MALKEFNIRLKVRADTEANWNVNSSEVLLENELIIVSEIGTDKVTQFKLGDGVKTYAELPFVDLGGSGADVDLSGYVPTSRTVNSKSLANDIVLSATDIGALAVGGKAVDSAKADMATVAGGLSVTLPISQGGTGQTTASAALSALGGVPTSRKINGQSLTSDITISAGNRIVLSSTQPTGLSSGDLWLKQL